MTSMSTPLPAQAELVDIDPASPMIALTFDDGPSKYTSQILDILERYDVRATFCVLGNLVNARSDVVQRAADLGNQVIGHSWNHSNLSKLSADEIRAQLSETNNIIESVTGIAPSIFRPPYGAYNNTVKDISRELGLAILYWSVDTLDWKTRNADAIFNAVMKDVSDRAIILHHDLYGSTAEAMERVIPELIAQGYQLVTTSELLLQSNDTLEAGRIYYSGK
jgi:peptidoglycan/xylan/chitin deacetylase (PgdA/CDA1 family)